MFWLNACPRCNHGAVYLDTYNSKPCVHRGFVQYRPLTRDFVVKTAASSDRSNIGVHIPGPRCHGFVVDEPLQDELICVNCGWRPLSVPADVQRDVDAHLGESSVERAHKHIPRGKPTLNWAERSRRRKARRSDAA